MIYCFKGIYKHNFMTVGLDFIGSTNIVAQYIIFCSS